MVITHPAESSTSEKLNGMVDSGATCTVIPLEVIEKLDLPFRGQKTVGDFSGKLHEVDTYSAKITISTLESHLVKVISAKVPAALIGRDMLNHYKVTLDGRQKQVEIE